MAMIILMCSAANLFYITAAARHNSGSIENCVKVLQSSQRAPVYDEACDVQGSLALDRHYIQSHRKIAA